MTTLEKNGITDYDHSARKVRTYHHSSKTSRAMSSRCTPHEPSTYYTCKGETVQADRNTPPVWHVQQFKPSDFKTFDYIFAMDKSNLSDLQRLQRNNPGGKAKVMLFGEYSGTGKAETVGDPYYGGNQGFEKAFEQCSRFARNFLEEVAGKE
jgi:hypothetical protein